MTVPHLIFMGTMFVDSWLLPYQICENRNLVMEIKPSCVLCVHWKILTFRRQRNLH